MIMPMNVAKSQGDDTLRGATGIFDITNVELIILVHWHRKEELIRHDDLHCRRRGNIGSQD
jgi:hypothetical protein